MNSHGGDGHINFFHITPSKQMEDYEFDDDDYEFDEEVDRRKEYAREKAQKLKELLYEENIAFAAEHADKIFQAVGPSLVFTAIEWAKLLLIKAEFRSVGNYKFGPLNWLHGYLKAILGDQELNVWADQLQSLHSEGVELPEESNLVRLSHKKVEEVENRLSKEGLLSLSEAKLENLREDYNVVILRKMLAGSIKYLEALMEPEEY